MEAKETVTPTPESEIAEYIMAAKNMQAEITWPIAYKAGIREVVEWIRTHNLESWIYSKPDGSESHPASIKLEWQKWQAQLKRWRI